MDETKKTSLIVALIIAVVAFTQNQRDEVRDLGDVVFTDQAFDEFLVADIALDEDRLGRHRPPEAGREIVDAHDLLAAIEQLQHHVAADVAGAAGNQYRHRLSLASSLSGT